MKVRCGRTWVFRLLAVLVGLGLVVSLEVFLRLLPGLGPAPLVATLAEHQGKVLRGVNRFYSQRFFFQEKGRLAASGKMAERFFVEPAPVDPYRIVFLGASTVQGFPHPRRLAAASFLEAMLKDVWPEKEVEVFNLGITSIASFAVAQVLKDALTLEPDLVVVYTGHNEFYGIYGAGDHSTPRYNRLNYDLRQLHLSHMLDGLVGFFWQSETAPEDLLQIMAKRGEVPLHNSRRLVAENHLRENLQQMSQTCKQAQVPLLLCTLAANDAGFAPVGSSAPNLEEAAERQWSEWVEEAARHLTRDYVAPAAAEKALEILEKAISLSGEHAWLWYLKGRSLERAGQKEKAYRAFRQARDLDTMPWRAPTVHNEIIRSVAQETGAVLADVETAFRQAAPPQGVGWELMVDHVHFSVRGQALLARTILNSMRDLQAAQENGEMDPGLLRGDDAYQRLLGDLPVENVMLYKSMGEMLSVPPMNRYNGHNARYLKQLAAMQWQALSPPEQRGVRAWTKEGKKVPLALVVADQLFEARDFPRAQAHYNASRREAPYTRRGDLWATVQWAWSIRVQEKPFSPEQRGEMRAVLERATFLARDPAIDPPFIDFVKGQLHHLLEEHQPALMHLERAFLDIDFRRKYGYSLFHALAAELVHANRLEDAQRYAQMASVESGGKPHFAQLVEAFSQGRSPGLFP